MLTSLVLLATACSQAPEERSSSNQTLRLNITSEPPSLDPTLAGDLSSGIILKMLFEGLTRIGRDGKPELAMAESMEVSEDKLTYHFKIREAYWSNGERITAQDFAYSWRMSLSPGYPSRASYQFYVIENAREVKEGRMPISSIGIKAVDKETLRVKLEHPIPYFLELTALHSYYPINYRNTKYFTHWASEAGPQYLSNGPFRMVSWRHNNEIVMEKNPNYWDADAVKLERIVISMIEDPTTELNLFEDAELDWAGTPLSIGLPSDSIPSLRESGQLNIKPKQATYFYQFNTKVPPLTNPKIRKAFAYAINRQAIVEHITQAGEAPALGFVPQSIALRPEGYFTDHNISEARRLFQEGLLEEGLTRETFPAVTLSYNSNESHHKIAQVVQQQWQEVLDVYVDLENFEWKVYLDNLNKHNFDIGRLSWIGDIPDPINFLEMFKYDTLGGNHTQWVNEEFVKVLDRSLDTTDPIERHRLLEEAEAILMEGMPISPVFFLSTSYIKNPRLKGVFLSELGDIDFRWAYLEPLSENESE